MTGLTPNAPTEYASAAINLSWSPESLLWCVCNNSTLKPKYVDHTKSPGYRTTNLTHHSSLARINKSNNKS